MNLTLKNILLALNKRVVVSARKAKASNSLAPLLPPQILEWEILTRLPVQSLVRYKSICKSWNLLISSNHDFIKSQFVFNTNKNSLILQQVDHQGVYSDIPRDCYIIGCIDGLVCFYRWRDDDPQVIEIKICNPALNRCLVKLTLKKDVELSHVLIGFGFDSVANDFKVMYGYLIKNQPLLVDVYSCKAACWKSIDPSNILYSGKICTSREPTIVNGCPFWLIKKNDQDAEISLVVIWFDVQREVFRLLPSLLVPSCDRSSDSTICVLMNFRDSIAIMVYDRRTYFVEPIDVYTFNHRYSDWDKISIGPFTKEPNYQLSTISVGKHIVPETTIELHKLIPCLRNGDIFFENIYGSVLYSINPETRTIKFLKEDGSVNVHTEKCFDYSESLIIIEGMKPVCERDKFRFKILRGERLELAASYKYI